MSTTSLIALGIGLLGALGLVVTLAGLSLLSGTMEYFFGSAKLILLKSKYGKNGFAFGFSFNPLKLGGKFDQFKIRLYNPFGTPTQKTIHRTFPIQRTSFSFDVDLGEEMHSLMAVQGFNNALIEVSILGSTDGSSFSKTIKAFQFLKRIRNSNLTTDDFDKTYKEQKSKLLYQSAEKSFISPPLEGPHKALKIASNPEFAAEFTSTSSTLAPAAAKENFPVTKVWIEPGCIVCNACENIYPEVFQVNADTCIVKPDYPTTDGLKVQEAAEACPVEVIKFTK